MHYLPCFGNERVDGPHLCEPYCRTMTRKATVCNDFCAGNVDRLAPRSRSLAYTVNCLARCAEITCEQDNSCPENCNSQDVTATTANTAASASLLVGVAFSSGSGIEHRKSCLDSCGINSQIRLLGLLDIQAMVFIVTTRRLITGATAPHATASVEHFAYLSTSRNENDWPDSPLLRV